MKIAAGTPPTITALIDELQRHKDALMCDGKTCGAASWFDRRYPTMVTFRDKSGQEWRIVDDRMTWRHPEQFHDGVEFVIEKA